MSAEIFTQSAKVYLKPHLTVFISVKKQVGWKV